jgi:hypothetical protein
VDLEQVEIDEQRRIGAGATGTDLRFDTIEQTAPIPVPFAFSEDWSGVGFAFEGPEVRGGLLEGTKGSGRAGVEASMSAGHQGKTEEFTSMKDALVP